MTNNIILSDFEPCHSISKSISDEKDIFKSVLTFDIMLHSFVFKVIVESSIVVPTK